MKVGIYGDSFGASPIQDYTKYNYIGPAWWEILEKKYIITNYCEWSASLLYSTSLFLDTYDKHDKIIFLVTHPGRITAEGKDRFYHFVNYEYSTFFKKRSKKENWEDLLTAVLYYYKHLANDKFNLIQHFSYLELIKSVQKDVYFIPCFENSLKNFNFCLCDIFNKEQEFWKINYSFKNLDIRKGHLSNENHIILAEKIDKYLETKIFDFNINQFTNPILDKKKYIIRI